MKTRTAFAAIAASGVLMCAGVAMAVTPGPDVQANAPQVAGDAGSDTSAVFPTNKQNEPTIAVNPLDSNLLIAGSNDEQEQPPCGPGPVRGPDAPQSDCSFFFGVGTDGVYTSSDGGASWTNQGLIDDQASWQGLGVISDGDPVITYGPKPDGHGGFNYTNGARAYYASLATVLSAKGFEYVIVSYSDDDGVTWSAPVVGMSKSARAVFNDKNFVTVDGNPASPWFGRLYLTWTQFRSNTLTGYGNEPVMVSVSPDGGSTFGAPKQLSPASNNGTGNGRQGSSSAVGPDGTAYVAFEQGFAQVITISRDGGRSWSKPTAIGPVTDLADPIPGANFRTDSFLTLAADPREGSTTLYASWANRTPDGGRIVVATSTDGALSWSPLVTVSGAAEGYAFFQGLAVAPNGRVDVAYQALVANDPTIFGTGNAAINAYGVSKPVGGSWSAPVKLSTASSDPAASVQNNLQRQFWGDYNTLVSDIDGAWFISTDSRTGVGCPAVDAYQKYLVDNHLIIQDDDETPATGKAAPDPSVKPAPPVDCASSQFGNTDVRVNRFTP